MLCHNYGIIVPAGPCFVSGMYREGNFQQPLPPLNHSYTCLFQFTTEKRFNLWWVKYRGNGDVKARSTICNLHYYTCSEAWHMYAWQLYITIQMCIHFQSSHCWDEPERAPHSCVLKNTFAVKGLFALAPMVQGSFCALTITKTKYPFSMIFWLLVNQTITN